MDESWSDPWAMLARALLRYLTVAYLGALALGLVPLYLHAEPPLLLARGHFSLLFGWGIAAALGFVLVPLLGLAVIDRARRLGDDKGRSMDDELKKLRRSVVDLESKLEEYTKGSSANDQGGEQPGQPDKDPPQDTDGAA